MFTDEALRAAINVQQTYENHMVLARELRDYQHSIGWKITRNHEYLYDNTLGKSLGARSSLTEAQFESYTGNKKRLRALCASYDFKLKTHCAFYKFSKLPLIDSGFARLCRTLDEHQILGTKVIVTGTMCMAAYELEAQRNFGLSSLVQQSDAGEPILLPATKEFHSCFCVAERDLTARNRTRIVFNLINNAGDIQTTNRKPLKTIAIEAQEWLLKGMRVDHVVCGVDRTPCRIVAPDPRWFALHKAWLNMLPNRDKLKARRDSAQAIAVWAALPNMGRFPIDDDFLVELKTVSKLWPAFEWVHKAALDQVI